MAFDNIVLQVATGNASDKVSSTRHRIGWVETHPKIGQPLYTHLVMVCQLDRLCANTGFVPKKGRNIALGTRRDE